MFTCGSSDVLDFKITYKITKKKRVGLLRLSTINDETVILNNGNFEKVVLHPTCCIHFIFPSVKGKIESGTLTAILGAR